MRVASFYAPREDRWGCDYDALLRVLDASCTRLGLVHHVISDRMRPNLRTFQVPLPIDLMAAVLEGQLRFLEWAAHNHIGPVLLVGADCLITRDPRPYLAGDIAITIGPFADCEMNTGAIWCADGGRCAPVWRAALDRKPRRWGDDQVALYAAIQASSLHVVRLRCEEHNWAPESWDDPVRPTVAHFRGPRKAFMARWGATHLGLSS